MAVVAVLLYLLFQRTFLGTSIRAVVDRRELAELAAIDANRVSQVAWTIGCTLAAVTGLIIAQGTLEPTKIIFFGIETFSVAVVARLTSVPEGDPVRLPRDGARRGACSACSIPSASTGGMVRDLRRGRAQPVEHRVVRRARRVPPSRRSRRDGGIGGSGLVADALGQRAAEPAGRGRSAIVMSARRDCWRRSS